MLLLLPAMDSRVRRPLSLNPHEAAPAARPLPQQEQQQVEGSAGSDALTASLLAAGAAAERYTRMWEQMLPQPPEGQQPAQPAGAAEDV